MLRKQPGYLQPGVQLAPVICSSSLWTYIGRYATCYNNADDPKDDPQSCSSPLPCWQISAGTECVMCMTVASILNTKC